jgi:hypothetical protein
MKKIIEEEKAITLIALVITIIVLLILASITIAMLTGDNGILNRAKKAGEKTEYNFAYEMVNLKILEAITQNNGSITIEKLKDYLGNDSQIDIEIVKYASTAYIKKGLGQYTGRLTGIYVTIPKYKQYTFLIGENCTIDQVADDGINFVYISDYEQQNGITNNNRELTEQQKSVINNRSVSNIKQDVLNKIAEALGISPSEANLNSISETMTQAEMESILEKYGTIQYDENYNITGIKINETGTIISISEIYSGTYKAETSSVSSGKTYSFQTINTSNEVERQREFEVPKTGEYRIECWGAQGGANGGLGAYTCGTIRLKKGDTLYICIGEKGETSTATKGGFNGGGYSSNQSLASGGGATDIRLTRGDTVYNQESLASRIMVAAGGSGGYLIKGLPGGALTGKIDTNTFTGVVATQTASATNAQFGRGAVVDGYSGAGGGYYGGGPCECLITSGGADVRIGSENETVQLPEGGTYLVKYGYGSSWAYKTFTGSVSLNNSVFGDPIYGTAKEGYIVNQKINLSTGGSSYISGHEGCIAVKSSNDISPKTSVYSNISDSVHYSGKYFKQTYMCAGDEVAENGERGNSGNGKVRITIL